jgi:hypothetical protein
LQESPPGAILMLRKLFVKICRASQKRRSLWPETQRQVSRWC